MTVKILLVDDHENIRRGLGKILHQASEMEIIGEAENGKEALELTRKLQPDIVLLDIEMPGMKGYDVAEQLTKTGASARVLALSGYNEERYILGMFSSGAVGYLTKEEAPQYLLQAVSEISAGRKGWVSPKVAEILGVPAQPVGQDTIPARTKLEMQILKCLVAGKTDQEMVTELKLELPVILANIKSIMRKLGAKSRPATVLRAIQEDLI